ncbi:MAG: hypothetical protein Q9216_007083 [Gyalolechia sp. 2 TL-2023]
MCESRKRAREDDDLEWEPQTHNHKKPRALPFRTSPTIKYINTFSQSPRTLPPSLLTPALTPVETSEDEGELKNPFRSPTKQRSAQLSMDSTIFIEEPRDMDMDVDIDYPEIAQSQQQWQSVESAQPSPCTITPKTIAYNPQEINNGGRIPTPIYGHFNRAIKTANTDADTTEVSPQTQQEIAHDLFLRRRRLPSPISEDEAMDDPDGMGGMLGRLDMGPKTISQSPFRTNRMWGGEPATPTRGKMTISMGYRADCEKCRMKVPGHYNHFVRA